MDREFAEDVLAEFAVVNCLALSALKAIAASKTAPDTYLKELLEDGLRSLAATNYWSVPADRKAAFLEKVEARWTDAITSIQP